MAKLLMRQAGSCGSQQAFGCPGYVVVTVNKVSGKGIEQLWPPREVREMREMCGNIGLPQDSRLLCAIVALK
jgi:hypothetical protein